MPEFELAAAADAEPVLAALAGGAELDELPELEQAATAEAARTAARPVAAIRQWYRTTFT
jgi:hypothetical protein